MGANSPKKVESTHPGGVYHVTDSDGLNRIDDPSTYVLYVDERTYCYFEVYASGSCLPEVRTGQKIWKNHYEVVNTQE